MLSCQGSVKGPHTLGQVFPESLAKNVPHLWNTVSHLLEGLGLVQTRALSWALLRRPVTSVQDEHDSMW